MKYQTAMAMVLLCGGTAFAEAPQRNITDEQLACVQARNCPSIQSLVDATLDERRAAFECRRLANEECGIARPDRGQGKGNRPPKQ